MMSFCYISTSIDKSENMMLGVKSADPAAQVIIYISQSQASLTINTVSSLVKYSHVRSLPDSCHGRGNDDQAGGAGGGGVGECGEQGGAGPRLVRRGR